MPLAAVALALATETVLLGQTDDFNDGNDSGWTHVDLSDFGAPADRTYPDDGTGGKAYRVAVSVPPVDEGGAPRALSYRKDGTYTERFQVSIDVLDWDPLHNAVVGVFGRLYNPFGVDPGIGQVSGYLLYYQPDAAEIGINNIDSTIRPENVSLIAATPASLSRDQAPYRLVLSGVGTELLAQVFSTADPLNPLASVVASDASHTRGLCGLLVVDYTNMDDSAYWKPAHGTFDNYAALAPPPDTLRATVVELAPRPRERVANPQPQIKVAIVDRDTYVEAYEASGVQLWVDGRLISYDQLSIDFSVTNPGSGVLFSGATITYQPPDPFVAGRTITNRIVFRDGPDSFQTNEWTFDSIALLSAANAAPPESGRDPGFAVRLVQTTSDQPLANTLDRAKEQLYGNAPIDVSRNVTVNVINFTQKAAPGSDGYFTGDTVFPGIDPAGNTDDIALEALFYLELAEGQYTLGVESDDGFQLASGSGLDDPDPTVIAERFRGAGGATFQFAVEAAGLYPFRLLWFERGGEAHLELFSMNPADPNDRTLINASTSTIQAYQSVAGPEITLESSSSVVGAFTEDAEAVIDEDQQTVTVPLRGGTQFYRLSRLSPIVGSSLKITGIEIRGAQVVLEYDFIPVIP